MSVPFPNAAAYASYMGAKGLATGKRLGGARHVEHVIAYGFARRKQSAHKAPAYGVKLFDTAAEGGKILFVTVNRLIGYVVRNVFIYPLRFFHAEETVYETHQKSGG